MFSVRDRIVAGIADVCITSTLAGLLALTFPTAAAAQSSRPVDMYGLQTNVLQPLNLNAMEYSEALFIRYPTGVDINAFRTGFKITPAAAVDISYPFVDLSKSTPRLSVPPGGGIGIRIRYAPGVKYTVTQPAYGIALTISSPPIALSSIPVPTRRLSNSPYYYGFLDHPWAFSGFLGGLLYAEIKNKTSEQVIALSKARSTLAAIAASGAGYVRMDFCGDQTIGQTAPYPSPKWNHYDPIIVALAAVHVTILPIVQQHCAPAYMHYDPSGSGRQTVSTPLYYAQWARAVAEHLKLFPQIKRLELFNEPNIEGGWYPGTPAYANPNGSGAAPFMKAAYAAIKSANPNLMVVSGALATGGHHIDSRTFLTNAYASGCRMHVCWDELSIHNYRWSAPGAATIANYAYEDRFDDYKDLQKIAVAHGDPVPKVMLTEWGYSTCEKLTVCFDPLVQALYLAQGLNLALADPSVDGITYVNIYNSSNDWPNYFWSHTALLTPYYTAKAGYQVFQRFALGSH